jgi:hypothetical protein
MCFVTAQRAPLDGAANTRAVNAFGILEDVARKAGSNSPHTFAVVARDGVDWLATAKLLGEAQRQDLARKADNIVSLGEQVCSWNKPFMREARACQASLRKMIDGEPPVRFPLG